MQAAPPDSDIAGESSHVRLEDESGWRLLPGLNRLQVHLREKPNHEAETEFQFTSRQLMRMMGKSDERWRKYLFY